MRNTLTRSASIALALALIAMLTPAGVSEAQGGKPVSWQVAFPTSLVGGNMVGFSLSAADGYAVFQDEGFRGSIQVGVSSSKREGPTHFNLMFLPGTAEEGYGVNIGGVEFSSYSETDGEPTCQFGTYCGSTPPGCLACLVNGDHPYAAYTPGYGFAVQIGTEVNIESQPEGEDGRALGRLYLYFDDYNDPSGQYHSVKCSTPPKTVTIQRSGPDEWTIFNDEPYAVLTCEELYLKPRRGRAPRYEEQTVMTAETAAPFVFETIWTRK